MTFVLADKHKDILDKYNEIWSKDNALLTKILTTLNLCTIINIQKNKINFHKNVIKTNFHDNDNGLS